VRRLIHLRFDSFSLLLNLLIKKRWFFQNTDLLVFWLLGFLGNGCCWRGVFLPQRDRIQILWRENSSELPFRFKQLSGRRVIAADSFMVHGV